MSRSNSLVALIALIALAASGAGVAAQPDDRGRSGGAAGERQDPSLDATARRNFDQGAELVARGRYVDALAAFAAGYELSKRPLFLFNMGECARLADQRDRAIDYYKRYLEAEPNGKFATLARDRLRDVGPDQVAARPEPPPPAAPPPQPTKLPTPVEAAKLVAASPQHVADPLVRSAEGKPLWKQWPLWAALGVVVIGGTVLALTAGGSGSCGDECIDLR